MVDEGVGTCAGFFLGLLSGCATLFEVLFGFGGASCEVDFVAERYGVTDPSGTCRRFPSIESTVLAVASGSLSCLTLDGVFSLERLGEALSDRIEVSGVDAKL